MSAILLNVFIAFVLAAVNIKKGGLSYFIPLGISLRFASILVN
jgi:hypothetical protein